LGKKLTPRHRFDSRRLQSWNGCRPASAERSPANFFLIENGLKIFGEALCEEDAVPVRQGYLPRILVYSTYLARDEVKIA